MNNLIYKNGGHFAFAHYNQRDAACKAKAALDKYPLFENILSADLIEDQEDFSASGQKSDNLQYNTVLWWVDGTIVLSSAGLMFIMGK